MSTPKTLKAKKSLFWQPTSFEQSVDSTRTSLLSKVLTLMCHLLMINRRQAWDEQLGKEINVDKQVTSVNPEDYDALCYRRSINRCAAYQ